MKIKTSLEKIAYELMHNEVQNNDNKFEIPFKIKTPRRVIGTTGYMTMDSVTFYGHKEPKSVIKFRMTLYDYEFVEEMFNAPHVTIDGIKCYVASYNSKSFIEDGKWKYKFNVNFVSYNLWG